MLHRRRTVETGWQGWASSASPGERFGVFYREAALQRLMARDRGASTRRRLRSPHGIEGLSYALFERDLGRPSELGTSSRRV
jgi:hypothetical protein